MMEITLSLNVIVSNLHLLLMNDVPLAIWLQNHLRQTSTGKYDNNGKGDTPVVRMLLLLLMMMMMKMMMMVIMIMKMMMTMTTTMMWLFFHITMKSWRGWWRLKSPHYCLLNVYSRADQRKYQSSASLAFLGEFAGEGQ